MNNSVSGRMAMMSRSIAFRWSAYRGWRIAVLLAGGLTTYSLTLPLPQWLSSHPFPFFYAYVLLITWFGDALDGVGAVLTSACILAFVLPPARSLAIADPADVVSEFVFTITSLFLVAGLRSSRRARAILRQAQETAETERQRLYEMFQQAPAAIIVVQGPSHTVSYANHLARKLCPQARCPVDGQPLAGVFPALGSPDLLGRLTEVSHTGQPWSATGVSLVQNSQPPGQAQEAFFSMTFQPLRTTSGATGVLIHAIDVTVEVQARRALEREIAERQRTEAALEASQQHLSQAHRAAEDALRVQDRFLATVSHELQTPLTAVRAGLGLLEVSASERLTSAEQALLENARRNTELLRHQIADLLTINELAARAVKLECSVVDLNCVVGQARVNVDALLLQKGQVLDVQLPVPLDAWGDSRRLIQVVVNLLSNACRHTPAGTHICITGQQHEDGGVSLIVSDNGSGIAIDDLERIFERYQRRGQADSGVGLGLPIARGIAELHGGRLWATSTPGDGVSFHLWLPPAPDDSEKDVPCPAVS